MGKPALKRAFTDTYRASRLYHQHPATAFYERPQRLLLADEVQRILDEYPGLAFQGTLERVVKALG